MTEERFWLLVSLKLSGEALSEELAELETYLQKHPERKFQAERVNALWLATTKTTPSHKEISFNKHMQRLSNHLSEPVLQYESIDTNDVIPDEKNRSSSIYKKLAWVTGIAASLLIFWFVIFDSPANTKADEAKAQNTISTKRGSKSKIQLPDGTEVWLNADSKITYNENFQGDIREVHLSGEAFFDVVRDETRPFVIHTNVIDVKVLGTAFNVRSYADEKNTETSLIRGSVEVTLRSNPEQKYTLKPNDKLTVDNNMAKALTPDAIPDKKINENNQVALSILGKVKFNENESSASETLWVKNKLAFDKEPMEEIALKIERWYDVKVIIDERIKKEDFTGTFEGESLQQVMQALQLSGKFRYSINKKEVTIRPAQNH